MIRRALFACALGLAVAGSGLASVRARAQPAGDPPCRDVVAEGAHYAVCTVDLRRYTLKLFWKAPDGQPYASLARLVASPAGREAAMAVNAGMYQADLSPVGLFVADGRELHAANTASGSGNFHLKPNGVFYVAGDTAGILETSEYLKRRLRPDLATQSGPMLVIGGAPHPQFSDEGPSRKIRNGVGLRDPHTAVFAVSDGPVSFGAFARLFRDTLGCRDALFLDGSISTLYAPSLGRNDMALKPLGPILAALPRAVRGRALNGSSTKP